ncbi:MAG: radical SAM family heme chaperone HemW [Acidobacteria bacterium]|nr:radical SAM family heme chaperone HemW [Acidobacteriota bacterium]
MAPARPVPNGEPIPGATNAEETKPGVYLHFPFCRRRCLYCDFQTFPVAEMMPGYTETVYREACFREELQGDVFRDPDTIFLGGGSPSLLTIPSLTALLRNLRTRLNVAPACETTLEVNPEDVDSAMVAGWRAAGINRISLGVQTMQAAILRRVQRAGGPAMVRQAMHLLRRGGFENVNCDLILGLPGETGKTWRETLDDTLALAPDHLSVYLLEIHENGRLSAAGFHDPVSGLTEDDLADLYLETRQTLQEHGLKQYEISNFARPGRTCRHNLKYWSLASVLGLGAGAHGFDGRCRWRNAADPREYQRALMSGQDPECWRDDGHISLRMEEFVFLGLRRSSGIDLREFRQRFGQEFPASWCRRLKKFVERKLLLSHNKTLRLLPAGMLLSNEIFQSITTKEP